MTGQNGNCYYHLPKIAENLSKGTWSINRRATNIISRNEAERLSLKSKCCKTMPFTFKSTSKQWKTIFHAAFSRDHETIL